MKKKQYSGVWIPKELLNIGIKNGNEKILLAMIVSLSNEQPCTASDKYFAELLHLSISQINRMISTFERLGYIHKGTFNSKRQIILDSNLLIRINADSQYANMQTPIRINADNQYANMRINSIVDNIIINTSTTTEKLKSNLDLIESVCKEKNIDKEFLNTQIETFSKLIQDTKKIHKDDNDLYSHFKYWLDKYKPKEEINSEENEKNYLWFIKLFNEISKRDFKPSEKTKEFFYKQFKNGFSGDDCRKAIQNLYSSSTGNRFHIDSKFKFATPQYLLKEDNLNKYLNFKP
jgi:hypothetical protein